MDKASFFILNIFLNSFFAFFTAVLLVEAVIFLFRIKQGRIAALLRMIPIAKLPLDLCLYDFSRWSYIHGINPLCCAEGTRTFSIILGSPLSHWYFLPIHSTIQFTLPGNMTFTISDMIGYMIQPLHLTIFSILFVLLCVCFFIKKLVTYSRCKKALNFLAVHSEPASKKVRNPQLMQHIKKGNYAIFTSSVLQGSPFVTGLLFPIIYIPNHLTGCLSRKEYEAVLSHEVEHVRNKDIFMHAILDIIASIFWWIPTQWLRNRIKEGQEISCDDKCRKYGIDSVDLASAICKSAKSIQNNFEYLFIHHFTQHKTRKRIKMLLQSRSSRLQKTRCIFTCLAMGIAFLLILFGRFWMF